jgi:cupin 2 domain-containing protein
MVAPANIFADMPAALTDEHFTPLWSTAAVRVERIISRGHASPPGFWFDQDGDEWVLVLQGAALIRFEGQVDPIRLTHGDYLRIPAHARHRVEWTDPDQVTVWLAIHQGPLPDQNEAAPTDAAST